MDAKRTLKIIAWLMENSQMVNDQENIQIVFNCSGDGVSVELKKRVRISTRLNGTARRLEAMADQILPYLSGDWENVEERV